VNDGPTITGSIDDVIVRELTVHGDHRGRVLEGWRDEWAPFTVRQLTEGRAQAGVLKGLHLHYKQWDWWRLITGSMLVALYDARPDSATYGATMTIGIDTFSPTAVGIPPGVAHGYYALEDLEMIYLLSEVYDPSDEHGIRWDSVGLEWPYIATGDDPIVSERDINLPTAEEFEFTGVIA
jgi:dTDP-4-dehydrorhamnose 3,5-epimerase